MLYIEIYIYNYEHYGLSIGIEDAILFFQCLLFCVCSFPLHVRYVFNSGMRYFRNILGLQHRVTHVYLPDPI